MANKFKTFVAGDVLTAAQVNDYLMKQAVIEVDSSSDYPASPKEGMVVYNKATDSFLAYTTATTGWRAPWNLPWGRIAGASSTAATSSIEDTAVDVNNCSVTFTAVANRYYKTTVIVPIYQQATAGGYVTLRINDGTNDKLQIQHYVDGGQSAHLQMFFVETIAAGSATRKARISVDGTGTGSIAYTATYPASILVEDIGPSAGPA